MAPADIVILFCANSRPLSRLNFVRIAALSSGVPSSAVYLVAPGIHRTFRCVPDVLGRIEIGLSRPEHDGVPALRLQVRRKSVIFRISGTLTAESRLAGRSKGVSSVELERSRLILTSNIVELDALCKRQRPAMIDGRSSHGAYRPSMRRIRIRVRHRFLSRRRMHRQFCAGRPNVDVGNAGIGATSGDEGFGFAQVIGEDRGRPALCNGVVQFEYIIEVALLHHVKDRRESLELHGSALRGHLDERRAHVVGAGRAFDCDAFTATNYTSRSFRSL